MNDESTEHGHSESLSSLALGAIGVVFGDIGTSPLYALKESFIGHHPLAVDPAHVFGVLSLVFWTMMLIVTCKYVFVILRADNKGEGGSLALLALIARKLGDHRMGGVIAMLGVIATALFYGDAIITPAISVLSAVEGLTVVNEGFADWVLPLSIGILIGLFAIQSRGTAAVGKMFGPVMMLFFGVLALLGGINIVRAPEVLWALSPHYAFDFFLLDPALAFLALGSVVLAVTGAEALYADMGHFGRKAIMVSWLYIAFPCLVINYLGQSALLLTSPHAVENPFFYLAPQWARLPLCHSRDGRDCHRQPGGDFRRVFGVAASGTTRLSATAQNPAHQREGGRPDLCSDRKLGLAGTSDPAGHGVPDIQQSRCRIWHSRHRNDVHHRLYAGRAHLCSLEMEPVARDAGDRGIPDR